MTDQVNGEDNVTKLAKLIDMDEKVIRASALSAEKIQSLFNNAVSSKKYSDRLTWPGFGVALVGAGLLAVPTAGVAVLSLLAVGATAEAVGAIKDRRHQIKEEITKIANDRLVALSSQPLAPPQA
jgi:hypothetical protein